MEHDVEEGEVVNLNAFAFSLNISSEELQCWCSEEPCVLLQITEINKQVQQSVPKVNSMLVFNLRGFQYKRTYYTGIIQGPSETTR